MVYLRHLFNCGYLPVFQKLYEKTLDMTQNEVPVSETTYDVFSFLSGMGFWILIALALIGVFLYKKLKK